CIGRKGGRGTDRGDGCHYQLAAIDAFYSFIRHGEVLSALKSHLDPVRNPRWRSRHPSPHRVQTTHRRATSQARGNDRTIARMPSGTPYQSATERGSSRTLARAILTCDAGWH